MSGKDWNGTGTVSYTHLDVYKRQEPQETVFPVRGIVAVYVFVTSLYGAVVLCGDEERGLFLPLSYGYRTPCRIASMAAPVALSLIHI